MSKVLADTNPQVSSVAPFSKGIPVPLKYRSNCPSAPQLYESIMAREDFSHIYAALVRERVCRSEPKAKTLVAAWLQWFCAGATTRTKQHVMMVGPVDQAFHVMVLHTKWYFRFCHEYTGVYTHHDPLNATEQRELLQNGAIEETIARLERTFGNSLNPELTKWRALFKKGALTPAMVSCVGNDGPFDIVAKKT